MTQKIHTTPKNSTKNKTSNIINTNDASKIKTSRSSAEAILTARPIGSLSKDFVASLLVVSLIANAFIFITWLTLQVTTIYDYQLASFLFIR